jgi:hypothetical protein
MILTLTIISLVLGSLISILSLFNKKPGDKNLGRFTFYLALGYLLVLVIGVFSLIHKEEGERNKEVRSLEQFSLVRNIDSTVVGIVDSLIEIKNSTKEIKDSFENVKNQSLAAIQETKTVVKEYRDFAKQLQEQLEVDKLEFAANGPKVTITTQDMNWRKIDSGNYQLIVKYKNLGNRTASNFSSESIMIIRNSSGEFDKIQLSSTGASNQNLQIFPWGRDSHFYSSKSFKVSEKELESDTFYCIIIINIRCRDDALQRNLPINQLSFEWKNGSFYKYLGGFNDEIIKLLKKKGFKEIGD